MPLQRAVWRAITRYRAGIVQLAACDCDSAVLPIFPVSRYAALRFMPFLLYHQLAEYALTPL